LAGETYPVSLPQANHEWVSNRNGRGKVSVSGATEKMIETDKIIIATGSVPSSIPVQGVNKKGVINSDEILSLTQVPSSMAIIGGGVIGVEFAQIFSRFGTKVTIIEMMPRVLPTEDEEISHVLQGLLKNESIAVHASAKVTSFKTDGSGTTTVTFESAKRKAEFVSTDRVLMAVGRAPSVADLSAEKAGVAVGNGGKILVNRHMETTVRDIYAIGDVLEGACLPTSPWRKRFAPPRTQWGWGRKWATL
jgi:dihydrolipoamide dehydrogenase